MVCPHCVVTGSHSIWWHWGQQRREVISRLVDNVSSMCWIVLSVSSAGWFLANKWVFWRHCFAGHTNTVASLESGGVHERHMVYPHESVTGSYRWESHAAHCSKESMTWKLEKRRDALYFDFYLYNAILQAFNSYRVSWSSASIWGCSRFGRWSESF